MGSWRPGDTVRLTDGMTARILSEFGSGGQGAVYRVLCDGREYALKWYHPGVFHGREGAFFRNLENNVQKGAPTDAFLWPLAVAEPRNNSFGYLMELRPEGYEQLTFYFVNSKKKPQVRFQSFSAVSTAAIYIIQAFRELHSRGYNYQDVNDGNFFIHPETGGVRICDNDNVSPYGTNLGVMGKQRWMAPEVVTGHPPDKRSDRFSLALVLFRLLFINHPLEGQSSTPPCMTKELERKYYGTDPVFILDPKRRENRPIPGTEGNLRLFWEQVYPQYIRDAFIRAFSRDVMLLRSPRILEKEWLDLFFRLRGETVLCPRCGQETFLDPGRSVGTCMECGASLGRPLRLRTAHFSLPVLPGERVWLWQVDSSRDDVETVLGSVVPGPAQVPVLGLRNESGAVWRAALPGGDTAWEVPPEGVVPLMEGVEIDFLGGRRTAASVTAG